MFSFGFVFKKNRGAACYAPTEGQLHHGCTAGIKRLGVIIVLPVLLFTRCTTEYNPFSDQTNVRAEIVYFSVASGDSANIFTRETLLVSTAVREQIDSFKLSMPGNRFGRDTTIRAPSQTGSYRFVLSFSDTGNREIGLTTFRSGGSPVYAGRTVRVVSPLSQIPLSGNLGERLQLSTPAVGDIDVMYRWEFGGGFAITSLRPDTLARITGAGYGTTGWLFVMDRWGRNHSPSYVFSCNLADVMAPRILFPTMITRGDTIITADSLCLIRAFIEDQGRGTAVKNVQINNVRFPTPYPAAPYFSTVVAAADTPLPILVTAWDLSNNPAGRTMVLRYDPAAVRTSTAVISVRIPAADSVVTVRENFTISGSVMNLGSQPLQMNARIGTVLLAGSVVADAGLEREWSFVAPLSEGANRIQFFALSASTSDTVADTGIVIIRDPHAADVVAPMLLSLKLGESGNLITGNAGDLLAIVAADDGAGIQSLALNGTIFQPSQPNLWVVPVSLRHLPPPGGNPAIISIIDSVGNRFDTTCALFLNSPPALVRMPRPPVPLVAKTSYRDTIAFSDADNDPLQIIAAPGMPSGFVVSGTGIVSWQPQIADTGWHDLEVLCSDGYGPAVNVSFRVCVVDPAKVPDTLLFKTTEADFGSWFEADRDSCVVPLAVTPGSGLPPFRYTTIRRTTGERRLLFENVFRFYPELSDTGFEQFTVIASDTLGFSDTIRPAFEIVPENRPCSVSVDYTGPTLFGGVLNRSQVVLPDTLKFSISDPDITLVERISATLIHGDAVTTWVLDSSRTVAVALSYPSSPDGRDTLSLSVIDKAGHTAMKTVFLWFGSVFR